jgi:hypothetical protein
MSVMNVGADGLLAGMEALQQPAEEFGNDGRVEQLWAMKAMEHAEVYFNLLCSVDPGRLKLTGSAEQDEAILKDLKESFPDLNVQCLTEEDIKSESEKVKWREFAERYKHIEDYSLGCLFRLDSSQDYSEHNSIIVLKIQFFALEIARNKAGFNDAIRTNFKPTPRKKREQPKAAAGGMSEVEAELQQIIMGNHAMLR